MSGDTVHIFLAPLSNSTVYFHIQIVTVKYIFTYRSSFYLLGFLILLRGSQEPSDLSQNVYEMWQRRMALGKSERCILTSRKSDNR